jgi:hypothetical protein
MKRLIALAASVALNATALGALAVNVHLDQTPAGQVYITELSAQKDLKLAQVDSRAARQSLYEAAVMTP